MRLVYLPVNAAWVFVFGDSVTRMGSGDMFHVRRADAVRAANACGLSVSRRGIVEVAR
jgi:hypothetical protein